MLGLIVFVQGIVILGMGYWIASLQTRLAAARRRNASLRERVIQPGQLLEA